MRERQTYQLGLYDRPLARLPFERTLTDFCAAHPEGKIVSERRLDVLSDFVRTRAHQLLGQSRLVG